MTMSEFLKQLAKPPIPKAACSHEWFPLGEAKLCPACRSLSVPRLEVQRPTCLHKNVFSRMEGDDALFACARCGVGVKALTQPPWAVVGRVDSDDVFETIDFEQDKLVPIIPAPPRSVVFCPEKPKVRPADPYWAKVVESIEVQQEQLRASGQACRCLTCDKLFSKAEERPGKAEPWVCGSCAGANLLSSERRKKPAEHYHYDDGADSPWHENAVRAMEGD